MRAEGFEFSRIEVVFPKVGCIVQNCIASIKAEESQKLLFSIG